jgi:Na+/proline symporter
LITLFLVIHQLSDRMSFIESLHIAGATGHLNIITTSFDPNDKFTLWSGLFGGFFLQLAYFGTDQSQVGRYLSGKSVREAKLGMMFNGLVKIPLQFIVLLTGVLVFVYYLFNASPVHWNSQNVAAVEHLPEYAVLQQAHEQNDLEIQARSADLLEAVRSEDDERKDAEVSALSSALSADSVTHSQVQALIKERVKGADPRDDDHIFLSYVLDHFPMGIIGLFVAVLFCASMSTSSAELNALATTTTVDVIKRDWAEAGQVRATQWATIAYGLGAMAFAGVASRFGNLIQAVNTVGSLFYGTILGIFLVAFFLKQVQGRAVFIAALIAEAVIITLFALQSYEMIRPIGFLWFNLIAPAIVIVLSLIIHSVTPDPPLPDA